MLTFKVALLALLLQGITLPQPEGFVNDFARILDAGAKARIEAIINDVRTRLISPLAFRALRSK